MGTENDRVIVYPDIAGQYRWRRMAGNHRKISASGEAFFDLSTAKRAAERANPGVEIVVEVETEENEDQ